MESSNISRTRAFREEMKRRKSEAQGLNNTPEQGKSEDAKQRKENQEVHEEKYDSGLVQVKLVQIFSAIQKAKEKCKESEKPNFDDIFKELIGEVAQSADQITELFNIKYNEQKDGFSISRELASNLFNYLQIKAANNIVDDKDGEINKLFQDFYDETFGKRIQNEENGIEK